MKCSGAGSGFNLTQKSSPAYTRQQVSCQCNDVAGNRYALRVQGVGAMCRTQTVRSGKSKEEHRLECLRSAGSGQCLDMSR
jgi:hypothetical protein